MLRTIGVRSTEELIEQVIPDAIRLKKPLNLPPQGMSEYQFAAHIRAIAGKNKLYRSLIGIPRSSVPIWRLMNGSCDMRSALQW